MPDRDETRDHEDLGGLFLDLIQAGHRIAEHLAELPPQELAEFSQDPLRVFAGIGTRLGVRWEMTGDELLSFARSRLSGTYARDAYGFDPEFAEKFFLPLLRPLVDTWFRVEVRGMAHLPSQGPALLVSNHAGALPLDAVILQSVVHAGCGRHVRPLAADLVFATSFGDNFARRIGAVPADPPTAVGLLASGELVSVFPEGFDGLGKGYAERYRLRSFGRGGFVATAVKAGAPIIPVAIVGSEESYPMITGATEIAGTLGLPYLPITPFFPWLGLLGMIPLPSKWIIEFGKPIASEEFSEVDPDAVDQAGDGVRELIQAKVQQLVDERGNPFA